MLTEKDNNQNSVSVQTQIFFIFMPTGSFILTKTCYSKTVEEKEVCLSFPVSQDTHVKNDAKIN